MLIEKSLEIFVGANFIVLAAAFTFLLSEGVILLLGYRHAFTSRLGLLIGSLGFAAMLPLVLHLSTVVHLRLAPPISEILVTQYLKGNIAISAVSFDSLLSSRLSVLQALHSGSFWAAGTVGLIGLAIVGRLVYIFLNFARIHRLVREGCCIRRTNRVRIIVSSEISIPFSSRGLRNFYVVIPDNLLRNGQVLSIAIGHEFQHIRQRDVTIEFLLAFCSPFFVLNPGFWFLSRKVRRLREYSCDLAFLKRSGIAARDYASALLNVAKQASDARRLSRIGSLSVPFVGSTFLFGAAPRSQLAKRVLVLANKTPRRPHMAVTAGLLIAGGVAMITLASVLQPASGWSHDRIMISSVANLERLNARNGGSVLAFGEIRASE